MSSNIEVKLDVLNQKASPALYAASLANRPAASFTGRLFVDSDSPSTGIYRDTGTTWVQVADQGAGTTGTLQQVTTNGSSTTVGISTSGNGIGIGTTIPASNRLDIHSSSGINATFNGTGTSNAALQLQLAGTAKWNLSNFYNAGANDFIVNDVTNSLNRITVKNTGQTFIGADTTSSGLLVVNSATADSQIVIIGANSPSFRIRNTGTAPTLNVGLGISTGVNNFIQSSASGDFCIFNGNTTASPITFGIYDSGASNIQEAARISASRNLLIGTNTDSGYKLSVSGTANITGVLTLGSTISNGTYSYTLPSANGTLALSSELGSYLPLSGGTMSGTLNMGTNTITSVGNLNSNTAQIGNDGVIQVLTLKGGSIAGSSNNVQLRFQGTKAAVDQWAIGNAVSTGDNTRNFDFYDLVGAINTMRIVGGTGNVLIGTNTDSGYKLSVNGTVAINDKIDVSIGTTASNYIITSLLQPNFTSTAGPVLTLGIAHSSKNSGAFQFVYSGSGNDSNYMRMSLYGVVGLKVKGTGVINLENVPTSATGLVSGDVYRTANVLNIVP